MDGATQYPGKHRQPPARALAWTCAASIAVAACGGGEAVRSDQPRGPPTQRQWPLVAPPDPARANGVLMRAISLVGTPYRYGGDTPDGGFDCSGLVNYVYRDALDLRLPRSSRELSAWSGARIEPARLAAGDLVFFGSAGTVTHVGIYVGEGRFVHAPSSGGTVRLDSLDGPYWTARYTGAKRVLD